MKMPHRLGLFSWIISRQEIERLACEIEVLARNRLRADGPPRPNTGALDCLRAVRSLLEVYVPPNPELFSPVRSALAPGPGDAAAPSPARGAPIPPRTESAVPSPVAERLIKLRDALLVSKRSGTARAGDLLDGLYTEIGAMLELEGIQTLDANGRFDPEYQCAVDTLQTVAHEEDDTVYATVRPGYRLDDTLVRPQDVVVRAYHPEGRQ